MLINPRLHKGLFAVKEATMPYIQSAVHAFEPSYTKHPKQSFTGGIYQPLADESMTDTPLLFQGTSPRGAVYAEDHSPYKSPRAEASTYRQRKHPPVTCDTNILAIADEQHASSFCCRDTS